MMLVAPALLAYDIKTWDGDRYVAVTVGEELAIDWWLIEQNDEDVWEIAPLDIP